MHVVPRLGATAKASGFGRDRRVRRRSDFLRIQGGSRRVSGPHFVLLVAAQIGTPGPSRLGMVVTTKVGNAVARNRIKRVCRSCFRLWNALLPDGVDLVVIARRGAETLGLEGIRAEWTRLLPQLRKRAEESLANTPSRIHLSAEASPSPTPKSPPSHAK